MWVASGAAGDSATSGPATAGWRDEVWVAPWSVLGAGATMPDAVGDLSRTFERWWGEPPVHGGVISVIRAFGALGGCPVRVRHSVGGDLVVEYVFMRARVRDVTPGLYVIPPGFVRREG